MSFEFEKKTFLDMSLERKRYHYKSNEIMLNQIPTWLDYWNKNKSNISARTLENVEKVNEELAKKVSIWSGDIAILEIDVVVNSANSNLQPVGKGVDAAIRRNAGPHLRKECATLGGCRLGEAKITGGYALPAKYIIHTVGLKGADPWKLRECYENSLALAKENKLRTIAFPCMSWRTAYYLRKSGAEEALSAVKEFLLENRDCMDRVIFCLFRDGDKEIYEELLQKYFGLY